MARGRHLHAHVRRRRLQRRLQPAPALPSRARTNRDPDGRQAGGQVWRHQLRRRPGQRVHGEAPDRRGLDQRWLHVLRAKGLRLPARGWRQPRGGRAGQAGHGSPAGRLQARSFLAEHGHPSRCETPRNSVAKRPGALEDLGLSTTTPPTFWRDRPTLVTGATGLVGGWLVRRLLGFAADVVCLVRDWIPQSELNRSGMLDQVKVVRGDVRDQPLLEQTLGEYEIDTVIHLAAQTIVPIANRNPISTLETNVAGTWALLEASHRSPSVKQIVLASSDKAYGDQEKLPYDESMPLAGRHPYDVSKSAADLIAQAFAITYRVPVAITRCGNFYGGGDLNWSRIVPGTTRSVIRGQRPGIRSLMGSDLEPDIRNEAGNEIRCQYLSAEKARQHLDWKPLFQLDEGLQLTIAWYRSLLSQDR